MSRIISRAESWEVAYSAFQQVNFNAFDFNSVKQSLLDYIKLYFPEDFNDYIESSEFVAILEMFAYILELFAYRLDLNAHENFITLAQRKDSVLRLAKLISYTASRNIPARGLTKLTSISTTETIFDSTGTNIANAKINWNDTNNSNWKEQFLLVLNRVLRQEFGSVSPTERVQVQDVLFEIYQVDNNPIPNGVIKYSANVSGNNIPMELVPSDLNSNGPFERRPDNTSSFTILYGQDGLGDGSDTTGFFCFTKQGTLAKETTVFDGVTPNQTYDVSVDNINDTDVWLNNIDPDTDETIDTGAVPNAVSGEWIEVDLANAQNIIFNTNTRREKYEIETLDNDQIRLIFGDGEFATVPSGTFDIWYRTSQNEDVIIPQNTVVNESSSFTYVDTNGNVQTLSFTFSLINSLQNSSPSETIDHIRRVAPSVYFTQDRMVNNRDYNVFLLQDPTILKLRSINRTFAGDSKYIYWHDPSETYEHIKLFGCDAALYVEPSETFVEVRTSVIDNLIDSYIEPILSTTDFFTILTTRGVPIAQLRKRFTVPEREALFNVLTDIVNGFAAEPIHIYYHPDLSEFQFQVSSSPGGNAVTPNPVTGNAVDLSQTLWAPSEGIIVINFVSPDTWIVNWRRERIVVNSDTTKFWNTNSGLSSIDYDSLNSVNDRIIFLAANVNANRGDLFDEPQTFNILNQELTVDELRDIHRLNVLPADTNNDGISDNMSLSGILNGSTQYTTVGTDLNLPTLMLVNDFDSGLNIIVGDQSGEMYTRIKGSPPLGSPPGDFILKYNGTPVDLGQVANQIEIVSFRTSSPVDTSVTLNWKDYIYFEREDTSSDWEVIDPMTVTAIENWIDEIGAGSPSEYPDNSETGLYRRLRGRTGFNFAWFHSADRFRLIDPAQTNIIDTFIITRGYYISILDWLNGQLTVEPQPPTPLDLKTSYYNLLDNKMISDTLILHSGQIKLIIGSKAITELQAKLKIIRPITAKLTDNQTKTQIVEVVQTFFDINRWEFGETFYFTELAAAIHNSLKSEVDSVVLVPSSANHQFGDLFQVIAREDEIIQADIGVEDIAVIQSFTATNLRQDF
jgi:hypothetical protein